MKPFASGALLKLSSLRLFRSSTGLVHATTGGYGANSLMLCELDAEGPLEPNMRGLQETFDLPITCFQCVAKSQ